MTMETALQVQPSEATFSPAVELQEAFWKLKRSRIRVSVARSTRAGSIGHECERYIYYERDAGEQRTPHDEKTQCLFDLGNEGEKFVMHELEQMGFEIVRRQRDWLDKEYEIGAREDIALFRRGWPLPVPGEIKGLNPFTAETIETIGDIRESDQPWVRRYYSQLQTYLYFEKAPLGVFILLNKSSGQIGFIDTPRDQEHIDGLLARAARVRDAVRAHEPLPRAISAECRRCPFKLTCMPNVENLTGVGILDGAAAEKAEQLIRRRLELVTSKAEFDKIDKQLKVLLPQTEGELLIGNCVVTGSWVEREGYTVEATKYIQRKYATLKGA